MQLMGFKFYFSHLINLCQYCSYIPLLSWENSHIKKPTKLLTSFLDKSLSSSLTSGEISVCGEGGVGGGANLLPVTPPMTVTDFQPHDEVINRNKNKKIALHLEGDKYRIYFVIVDLVRHRNVGKVHLTVDRRLIYLNHRHRVQ